MPSESRHGTNAPIPPGAIGALILLAIIWGGSIPATKLALVDTRPLTVTALRFLSAAPFCLPLLLGRRIPRLRDLLAMLGLGALSALVGQTLQVLGVDLTTASVGTMIGATIPIMFVLLAALRLGQKLGRRHIAGLVCAFLGVGLIAVGNPTLLNADMLTRGLAGDGLMLISAAAVAVFYIGSTEMSLRYPPLNVAAWTSVGAALAVVPVLAEELIAAPFTPSFTGVAVGVYLGALVTVMGSWLWLNALSKVPARVAGALQYLQPLVGVGLSAILFGDRLDLWFAAGAALVFAGIALTSAPSRRRET